jgi:hypothetical protein
MHLDILFSFGLLALSSAAPTGGSGTKSALLASTVSPTYLNPTIATAEPTSKPGQKLPPLLPAIHWDHAGSKLEHLAPQSEHALYFSSHGVSDPRLQHAFSHFNATWQKHVVILDHSTLIQSVECSVGGIAIEFTSNTAYEYAKKAWPSDSDFMLVRLGVEHSFLDLTANLLRLHTPTAAASWRTMFAASGKSTISPTCQTN